MYGHALQNLRLRYIRLLSLEGSSWPGVMFLNWGYTAFILMKFLHELCCGGKICNMNIFIHSFGCENRYLKNLLKYFKKYALVKRRLLYLLIIWTSRKWAAVQTGWNLTRLRINHLFGTFLNIFWSVNITLQCIFIWQECL